MADIKLEHPSISGQHAVIQFRKIQIPDEEGGTIDIVKPYLLDIDSKNGTKLNGELIEPARYYELLNEDGIQFGSSSREYILMNAGLKDTP